MKGLTLLKNIKIGRYRNGDKFIYHEEENEMDGQLVCYENKMLYFKLTDNEQPLTSKELLTGEFIPEADYKMQTKIMNWLEKNMQVNNLFSFVQDLNNKNIINCYYRCTNIHFCEFYKDKIEMVIKNQEEII